MALKTNSALSLKSNIIIDEDGEVAISFLGPEILHLSPGRNQLQVVRNEWFPVTRNLDITSAKKEYESCSLCPKQCRYNRIKSAHPLCGDWQLKISNYGLSFGDENIISQGGGSGIIFLAGCHLDCPSCISRDFVKDFASIATLPDFLSIAYRLYQNGANNLQVLSPTVHFPLLRIALKELRESNFPLPIILKTSGYESVEEITKMRGFVDVWLPDYKFKKNSFWESESGAKNYHDSFQECLNEMISQTGKPVINDGILRSGVMVRHVKNPYLEKNEQEEVLSYLNSLRDVQLSVLDDFIVLD